jgi:hypothetical protein
VIGTILIHNLYVVIRSSERSYTMGRAIGMKFAALVGVRVAGQLTYIPAHTKNGKEVSSRCVIPVYANSNRGTDQKTGEKGRTDEFRLVAWGKLADTCCRSLPKGKAIDVFAEPHSYIGRKFNPDGTLFYDAAGQVVEEKKVAFTILNIVFGEESGKTVAEEIQMGRRPMNWNITNHPDFALWTQMLQQRQTIVWDGRSATFLYARVTVPQGPGIILNFSANQAAGQQFTNYAAPGTNLPDMVANAFGGFPPAGGASQPLFDPMTGVRLTPVQPTAMFDPMTGRPLNQAPAQPKAMFDPMTGQPISQAAAGSGFAPSLPPVGTALF